jgi:fused signal recognition particle receptor
VTRQIPEAPQEILLVLDATTGQNAISQAQLFHEALEITGIVLTKLDGTAKGGIVVGISHSLKVPIQYIGLGEKADDLQEFDADAFARALF